MKRLSLALAFLICCTTLTLAGPNAGGTIFAHDASLAYTSDITDYCGIGSGPASCEAADVNLAGTAGQSFVWKVYAAFPSNASPRLKGIAFGIHYIPEELIISARGFCPQSGTVELPGAGWPGADTGTSLVIPITKTDLLIELYWFAGYNYNSVPTLFTLRSNPEQGGDFADDSVPSQLDQIAGYGSLGFDEDGAVACPTALTLGACCSTNGECTLTEELACSGNWQGAGTVCEPNPCPPPPDGACCMASGLCSVTTEAGCQQAGGVWQGAGTVCDPNPCPQPPTGACCISGSCSIMDEFACQQSGGEFQGAGTDCDPNPCPITPTQNTSWGQIKATYR